MSEYIFVYGYINMENGKCLPTIDGICMANDVCNVAIEQVG